MSEPIRLTYPPQPHEYVAERVSIHTVHSDQWLYAHSSFYTRAPTTERMQPMEPIRVSGDELLHLYHCGKDVCVRAPPIEDDHDPDPGRVEYFSLIRLRFPGGEEDGATIEPCPLQHPIASGTVLWCAETRSVVVVGTDLVTEGFLSACCFRTKDPYYPPTTFEAEAEANSDKVFLHDDTCVSKERIKRGDYTALCYCAPEYILK